MLHDSLKYYLKEIEDVVSRLEGVYVERYEEEVLSSKRINLRLRIRFKSGATIEISEAVVVVRESISSLGYRYHFQNLENHTLFRYDNTPHFPEFETFPHHKHTQTKVIASEKPSIREVIEEAGRWENQTPFSGGLSDRAKNIE
jgi:hypothetical protein